MPASSGGGNKWLKLGRDLGGRKLIEPGLVTGVLELPFLDGHIDDKANDTINQGGHDSHERDNGRPAQGADRRLAQDGVILFEGTKEAWDSGNGTNRAFPRGTRIRQEHECWTLGI